MKTIHLISAGHSSTPWRNQSSVRIPSPAQKLSVSEFEEAI